MDRVLEYGCIRQSMEYIIYCDESDAAGKFYANFYGGLLIRSQHIDEVKDTFLQKKSDLNLNKELKWQRITSNYLEKYIEFCDLIFDYVAADIIKLRIMFTQNIYVAGSYDNYQRDNKYFLLYYQFIKHAFGLRYIDELSGSGRVRLYLDKMPDTKEKVASFKEHIQSLNKNRSIREAGIYFDKEQIAEIDSKNHVLAQCLDIVLGAMQFRLNDKHLEKPEGASRRGKRTLAKEKLYKHINKRIREIYPNFNIGMSTSVNGDLINRWQNPYRHWLFMPRGAEIDRSRGKQKK